MITRLCLRSLQALHEGTVDAPSPVPRPPPDAGARRDTSPVRKALPPTPFEEVWATPGIGHKKIN